MRHDICVMRALAILAIVLHHSILYVTYVPYGADGMTVLPMDELSFHISTLCKIFGLGIFTFISGMLLRMQMPRLTSARTFLTKKVKRIVVPSVIMTVAYVICFGHLTVADIYLGQFNTHLWYLPFIFMALAITYFVRPDLSKKGILKIAAIFAGIYILKNACPLLSFRLDTYYPVFLAGYLLCDVKLCKSVKWGGYLVFLVLYLYFLKGLTPGLYSFLWSAMMITIGILAADVARRLVKDKPGRVVMLLDRQSFHIYLIHQFIINFILLGVAMSGPAWAWWPAMFIITMGASLLLCSLYDRASAAITPLRQRHKLINTP